ncbi:hypothetical protein PCL1606_20080 [Pseudomonas chlororaphis]|uniref:Uncharacterized protein n=1 Tax=Pseudomonas chlororaphis TaxID=587753 RepID=A0A0D5XWK6_9PSED|nr:hypothetical protein PCL1606_20080 [Pseudomonas chlororaphis]
MLLLLAKHCFVDWLLPGEQLLRQQRVMRWACYIGLVIFLKNTLFPYL